MRRPLSQFRPVGPFAQQQNETCNLMVGFPVEMPQERVRYDISDNPLEDIDEAIERRFNVSRSRVRHDRVRLSGFDAPVVFFVSFPYAGENETETARNIAKLPEEMEEIVEEATGMDLAANVSVWAGDKRSGMSIY